MKLLNMIGHKLVGKQLLFGLMGLLLSGFTGLAEHMPEPNNAIQQSINDALPIVLQALVAIFFILSTISWCVTPPKNTSTNRVG